MVKIFGKFFLSTATFFIMAAGVGANALEDQKATGSLYPSDAQMAPQPIALTSENERLDAPAAQLTTKPSPKPAAVSQNRSGALYPMLGEAAQQTPLGKSLGPAGYVLSDIGQSEEFRLRIQRAVGQHPVFHAQASQRAQARSAARAERAALYPQIAANVSGDYVIARDFGANTDNVVESLRSNGQVNAGLSVSQLLFDGGATSQRIASAKAAGRETEQSMSARINELSLSAVSAYHDTVIHQAIIRLGKNFIKRHEKLLADVEERERSGIGSKADVLRARARLAAARARVSQIKESARLAGIRYEEFFKEKPGQLMRPSFEALSVATREEAETLAVARNPDIAAAKARTEGARATFKAERARRLPEVRATANATSFDVLGGAEDYDVRAGVVVNYDLYSGGARGAAIERAREYARQQNFDEARIAQEVVREAAIAFERKEASLERLDALAEAVIAHHGARDLLAERFRVARGDLIDLLQSENDYFEASVAYLAGLADRDMATYGLMEYTGDLLRFFSPQTDYLGEDDYNG